MKFITLTKGYKAIVDDEDFEWLSRSKWQFNTGYAITQTLRSRNEERCLMHRAILNAPIDLDVDHINGNRLDNRKSNLRLCTRLQNLLWKKKRSDSKMKYKGVIYVRPSKTMKQNVRKKPFYSRIKIDGRYVGLGYFATQEEAAVAYNTASLEHYGEFGWQNEV